MSRSNLQYPAHRLSQIIAKLPVPARSKYRSLTALVDDHRAVLAASEERRKNYENTATRLVQRLRALDPQTAADDIADTEEELDGLRAELAQLAADRDRRTSVLNNVQQTLSQLEVWLTAWEAGTVAIAGPLRAVSPPVLPATVDVECDLTKVRQQIAALKVEAARLAGAPLPAADIKDIISKQLRDYAENGRPRLRLEGDKVDLRFADQPAFSQSGALAAPASSVISTVAWLFEDRIIELLTAGIDEEVAARGGGISIADRDARRADIEARTLELERTEEALVEHALRRGLEAHRRRDANPLAVLLLEPEPEPEHEPALAAAAG